MPEPLKSEGARLERKAVRSYLRRQIKKAPPGRQEVYQEMLKWMLNRQLRYEKKAGGL